MGKTSSLEPAYLNLSLGCDLTLGKLLKLCFSCLHCKMGLTVVLVSLSSWENERS